MNEGPALPPRGWWRAAQVGGVLFVGGVVAGASGFAQQASAVGGAEMLGRQGLLGHQAQAKAVGQGAQGFEQVAGERFARMAELVVVADAGVVACGVQDHGGFGHGQGVGERQEGVERIFGRTAVALGKAQAVGHHGAQAGKVAGGSGAFESAQALQAAGPGHPCLLLAQLAQGLRERVARSGVLLTHGVEPFALALYLAVDEPAGVAQAKARVQALACLRHAANGVAVRAAQQQAGAAQASGKEQQANAVIAKMAHQAGFKGDFAAQDDAGERRQGHGGGAFAIFIKRDGTGLLL